MPVPIFSRTSADKPLFYLQLGEQPPGLTNYAVAFLPDSGQGILPDSLELPVTWTTHRGIYIFLGSGVSDEPAFVLAVRSYVGRRKTRFLWITNPADPSGHWSASQLEVQQATGSSVGEVYRSAQILFRNYLLTIAGGLSVSLAPTEDGFIVSNDDQDSGIYFESGAGPVYASGPLELPFAGSGVGCLKFSLPLKAASGPGAVSDLDKLDGCCRYFVDDTLWPGFLKSLRYPFIGPQDGPITVYGNLDPVNSMVTERTFLGFLQSSSSAGSIMNSAFRTVYGEVVQLTPAVSAAFPNGPSLVFNARPTTTTPSDADPFYLTYEGSFALSFPPTPVTDGPAVARMMCGIAGVEYAGFLTQTANMVHFFSGQPAYAPVFTRVEAHDPLTLDAPPLTGLATTSWAYITPAPSNDVYYYAQPQESVTYQAVMSNGDAAQDDDGTDFMYYLEVFAGTFPATVVPPSSGDQQATAFPMVPYTLVEAGQVEISRRLETKILSPYRRLILSELLHPTEVGPKTGQRFGATPQGLLLQFDQGLRYWELMTLASNKAGTQLLQLSNITGAFKSALQTNQLFTVISNKDEFKRYCAVVGDFDLTIEGWDFKLSPDLWSDHNTIMILKYTDKSLSELAGDTSLWTWPDAATGYSDGVGNLPTTQAELQAIIVEARARAVNERDFRYFYQTVISSPRWNGIVFLRCPLSTASFPPELQGLAAGIDPARFYAHHLGINMTPVRNINQQISLEDSTIFGLIDYESPTDLTYNGLDYAYQVLSLKILFENSAIANFFSQVELMVNRLFGDVCDLPNSSRGNNLVLNGFYQRQGGRSTYTFTQQGSNAFRVHSAVLSEVETTSAQFITLLDRSANSDTTYTQFVLNGKLKFSLLSDFDIYSFGPRFDEDAATVLEEGHLQFANLSIDMSFPVADPRATSFTFNAGTMSFDVASSKARQDSLYNHFPLRLLGLVQAPKDVTPGDLGYISVRSPLPQTTLTYPWFSLNFELDLGTLGALASDAGFVVTLAAAWGAGGGETQVRAYVGLKLPGSASANPEIAIEGVIKLSFTGIDFTANRSEEGINYTLRFRNITLKVLSLAFPPGQVDVYLFGDPSGGRSGSLGWYAAYAKDD